MSTRMRKCGNVIWVSGHGRPPRIRINRSLLSRGDSAPPSTSRSTDRSRRTPRAPGHRSAMSRTAAASRPVALNSASRIGTAASEARLRPMSNAVRAGVVTGRLAAQQVSSSRSRKLCTIMPACACRSGRRISAGADGSSHLAPNTAAAERPHNVAPLESHAARARSAAVRSTSFGRYTSRYIRRYRRRTSCRDSSDRRRSWCIPGILRTASPVRLRRGCALWTDLALWMTKGHTVGEHEKARRAPARRASS